MRSVKKTVTVYLVELQFVFRAAFIPLCGLRSSCRCWLWSCRLRCYCRQWLFGGWYRGGGGWLFGCSYQGWCWLFGCSYQGWFWLFGCSFCLRGWLLRSFAWDGQLPCLWHNECWLNTKISLSFKCPI